MSRIEPIRGTVAFELSRVATALESIAESLKPEVEVAEGDPRSWAAIRLEDYNPRLPCTCGHPLGSHDASYGDHPCLVTTALENHWNSARKPCPCTKFTLKPEDD